MRKIIITLSVVIILTLLASVVAITNAAPSERRTVQVVTLPSGEEVTSDYYIKAGEIVEISGTVNGDVVVAGGQVFIDGVVNGDLLAVGGILNISGEVTQDLRVAGGQVTLSGEVGRNASMAGGNIEITKEAVIGGGLLVAGGNITLSAPITGDLYVSGGNVVLANKVGGNIDANVGNLRLMSSADVGGNIVYTSEEEILIDDAASVSGNVARKTLPKVDMPTDFKSIEDIGEQVGRIGDVFRVISFLSALIIGLIMVKLFPNYLKSTTEIVKENPWKALGAGIILVIVTPVVFVILLMTVVGIPLAFLVISSYAIVLYLTKLYFSYLLGQYIGKYVKIKNTYVMFAAGLLSYYILRIIPIVGGLTALTSLFMGAGMLSLGCARNYKRAQEAKIV